MESRNFRSNRVCGEQTRVWCSSRRGYAVQPACAGNSGPALVGWREAAVQPRVRGEQLDQSPRFSSHFGTAPRVRGTVLPPHIVWPDCRCSPACAGNRLHFSQPPVYSPVQPRVCGEQLGFRDVVPGHCGARVRGTVWPRTRPRNLRRCSPACAGNSGRRGLSCTGGPVQPRVCGEQEDAEVSGPACLGAAPRVRGTACRWPPREA